MIYRDTRLGMFNIFEINPQKIYVAFPDIQSYSGIPYEVQEWLFSTVGTDIEWGIRDGRRVGVFLEDQDAIAFKLKFNI
jgi:hypothetical protein